MNTFAERLRYQMNASELTQKELAMRTGLTEAAISRYLSGAREPKAVVVARLAQALNISADDLLGIKTESKSEIDDALRLVARNANAITDEQKTQLIIALMGGK